jgi:transposase-like protein
MESTEVTRTASESGNDEAPRGTQGKRATGTRRRLNDQQEQEVARLYAETETPIADISRRFGIGESSVYRVAQRHGAALRGRTATSSKSSSPDTRAAAAAVRPAAAAMRGRAAKPQASVGATVRTTSALRERSAVSESGNAPRTAASPAARAQPPARRTSATTRGRGAGATATLATVVAPRLEFRVSYVAVQVIKAANIADAIRLTEAAGAIDIHHIVLAELPGNPITQPDYAPSG